ncbi:nucleotide exchange factor GrpE [Ignatzschineria sp. LJL83]
MTKENLATQDTEENIEEVVETESVVTEENVDDQIAEIEALKAEKEKLYDQYIRAVAEAQNVSRRAEQDVSNAHKYALDKFVKDLLPIIDAMELEMKAVDENSSEELKRFREGSQLMYKMLLGVCEKYGVQQINPEGEKLNPEFHQAISMIPHDGYETNQIITVAQNGYLLNDRLIRAAQVIVAK